MLARPLFATIAAALLGACAHTPVSLNNCDLPRAPLTVAQPKAAVAGGKIPIAPGTYEQWLLDSLARPPQVGAVVAPPTRPAFLFVSGGGQNGAFGAGLLDEWRLKAGALPEFRTVTGVSTGALIGTTAFVGRTDKTVEGYTIAAEADLLKVEARGLIGIVRKGAAGTLVPLRRRIDDLLDSTKGVDDDVLLGEIGDAATNRRRKFVIGVVDLRGGEAWAIDMTQLAQRWQQPRTGETRARIKQCFIEALIASSSVPAAAPPVYIDDVMYIDGGARFGLFRAAEERALAQARDTGSDPVAFRIVNATWAPDVQCPYVEGTADLCPATGTLRKWDFAETALRAVNVLTNSVYRFSTVTAGRPGDPGPAVIEADAGLHEFEGTTCAAWRKLDDADKPPPVQFHPREMRCLIDYGRARMRGLEWWKKL